MSRRARAPEGLGCPPARRAPSAASPAPSFGCGARGRCGGEGEGEGERDHTPPKREFMLHSGDLSGASSLKSRVGGGNGGRGGAGECAAFSIPPARHRPRAHARARSPLSPPPPCLQPPSSADQPHLGRAGCARRGAPPAQKTNTHKGTAQKTNKHSNRFAFVRSAAPLGAPFPPPPRHGGAAARSTNLA